MWRFLAFVALVIAGLAAVFYYTGLAEERQIVKEASKNSGPRVVKTPLSPAKLAAIKLPQPSDQKSSGLYGGVVTVPGMELKPKEETEMTAEVDGNITDLFVDVGNTVNVGDNLFKLDDRIVKAGYDAQALAAGALADEKIKSADAEYEYSKKEHERLLQTRGTATSESEIALAKARMDLSFIKVGQSKIEKLSEQSKLVELTERLRLYDVKARIPGTVVRTYKKKGNNVRQGEPIVQIVNDKSLIAEGSSETGLSSHLKVGMNVVIEPENDRQALFVLDGHTGPVTALALAPASRFLASSSDDGSIILWNVPARSRLPWKKLERTDRRRVGCRCLAISPPVNANGDTFHLLAGYTDGAVYLWTVKIDARDNVTIESKALEKIHDEAVECVAFRGDGQYAASGSADRRIVIWDANQGKKLYYVHPEMGQIGNAHFGAVTSVNFSRDGQFLYSTGTDNTLRRWKLGTEGSELTKEVAGRSGDVRHINLADDGRYLLFDQGDELRILDSTTLDQVNTINSRRAGQFVQFAQFSPSGQLAVAPTDQGRNLLIRMPKFAEAPKAEPTPPALGKPAASAPSKAASPAPVTSIAPVANTGLTAPLPTADLWARDAAIGAQFTLPEAVKSTCAVFSPQLANGQQYLFLGSTDNKIRIWELPSTTDLNTPILARLKFISPQVESGTGLVRLQAEFENPPARKLETGKRVAMIVYPDAKDNVK